MSLIGVQRSIVAAPEVDASNGDGFDWYVVQNDSVIQLNASIHPLLSLLLFLFLSLPSFFFLPHFLSPSSSFSSLSSLISSLPPPLSFLSPPSFPLSLLLFLFSLLPHFLSPFSSRLRSKWCSAVANRREFLDSELRKLMDRKGATVTEMERQNELLDQWAMLSWQRQALLEPRAGSGLPGAPTNWWVLFRNYHYGSCSSTCACTFTGDLPQGWRNMPQFYSWI